VTDGRDGASLPELDEAFHAVYDRTREESKDRAPVIVVLGDALFLYRDRDCTEVNITSEPAQLLKETAHVPVGVFLTARRLADRAPLDEAATKELRRLLRLCHERRDPTGLGASLAADVAAVLDRCAGLLQSILDAATVDPSALRAFAADLGPCLLRLAREATRRQLATLDEATQRALAPFSAEERAALRVVVAGAHQARVRSLPMQYFQKLLGEAAGVEERVLYAEAVTDPAAARALVGTNLLDRDIAGAFFGDPRRLQRDVLGDIAAEMLATPAPAEATASPRPSGGYR
jgi:hypothetical protein